MSQTGILSLARYAALAAPIVLLIRVVFHDDALPGVVAWQEFLSDRVRAFLVLLLIIAAGHMWVRPFCRALGPLGLALAGFLLLLVPREPVLMGILADPMTQVPLLVILILPTLDAAAADCSQARSPASSESQILAAFPALIAALLIPPERESLLIVCLLHAVGSAQRRRECSPLPALLLLAAAGAFSLLQWPTWGIGVEAIQAGFLPSRVGGGEPTWWNTLAALLGPLVLIGFSWKSPILRSRAFSAPLAATFLLSFLVPTNQHRLLPAALVATGLTVLTFLGLQECVRRSKLRPIAISAVALIAAVHGSRALSTLPAMIARDQERDLLARATVGHRFQIDQPEIETSICILGSPPYDQPAPREHLFFPTRDMLPDPLGRPERRSRFLNWGPLHAFDQGNPQRYRITDEFVLHWITDAALTLSKPLDRIALSAVSAEDEPVFQWTTAEYAESSNPVFYFFWIGKSQETGRFRAHMRELSAQDLVKQSTDKNHSYTWRPSIRPMHGSGRELIWEAQDMGIRGSAMLWTVAVMDPIRRIWRAPALSRLWIRK